MKVKTMPLVFLLAVAAAGPAPAAPGGPGGYRPVVRYAIDARLFPEQGKLAASETLVWENTSRKPAQSLRFHLYYNAFRNEKSTFLQEQGYYRKSRDELKKLRFGGVDIKDMRIAGGKSLARSMRYIAPDDGNRDDMTLLEVPLERPVPPGGTLTLVIDFSLAIPQILSRTGMEGDYFFMSQWFPKIGVLERDGRWNCHQYHYNAEYYADYGSYRVTITLPGKFVLGATGNLVKKKDNGDGTVSYAYTEDRIHDFTWTAWPRFVKVTDSVRLPGNAAPTQIELLLDPRHLGARERYMDSLKFAIRFFADKIMPYPYRKITLVDPPLAGIESWGMEYPTLITAGHIVALGPVYNLAEMVTIHEFGHQYWYGIVGNDETREAWLDEGINTFFELEIMDAYYGGRALMVDLGPLSSLDWETRREPLAALVQVDRTDSPSWEFLDHDNYRGNVYSKTALLFASLKHLTGRDRMYGFFRHYARAWAFRHPKAGDFISAFNSYMKEDFGWAFDQFIRGDTALDNSVHLAESVKADDGGKLYRNEVVFMRNEGYFPVETLIRLANGKEKRALWKGRERWKRVVFFDRSPISFAAVDPECKVPLDRNLLNNRVTLEAGPSSFKSFCLQLGYWVLNFFSFLIF